ncbi:hypothetical protein CFOL_v3_09566 [Cephalotus follicularis]|uniref:Uncharacterized protein n=1 Tax=Cephalotus follicularis TaxID=3775 RepID=A0A1Q3BDR1_CEPFO|nr:hypothetical protein CFOL_v3_09566 [Cephalotus follicularis]
MDYASLPHFCRKEGSGSSWHIGNGPSDNCFSLDHVFHQQLYDYVKQQAAVVESTTPLKQGSFHVDFPDRKMPDLPRQYNLSFTGLGIKMDSLTSLMALKLMIRCS